MDRFLQEKNQILIESSQLPKPATLDQFVKIESRHISSHVDKFSVNIDQNLINKLLALTSELYATRPIDGFQHKNVPLEYVQHAHQNEIKKKLHDFLLRHTVVETLMDHLSEKKIVSSSYPRLSKIETPLDGPWQFNFDLSIAHNIELKEWRNFSFKQPRRKRYKDLDKQVVNFLEQEAGETKKLESDVVSEQDWVYFEATLCTPAGILFEPAIGSYFWINVKQHAGIDVLRDLFIGKQLGESFTSNLLDTDYHSNEYENYRYFFKITIHNIVKGGHLSLDLFKGNFKLKNKTEIHNKLMEVFSFRNDESQRRSTVEEIFHLLLSKHRFEVPKHLVLRRQEDLLLSIMKQPDYQVYKAQKDFGHHLELLAEKQLKEEILVDQIAYQEDIQADIIDAQHYFHLFGNKRLHEFLYFKPIIARLDQFNTPLNQALLKQTFTREKTLNFIIYAMIH